MAKKSRQNLSRPISAYFDTLSQRVFKQTELRQIALEHAEEWELPKTLTSTPKLIAFLLEQTQLREIIFRAESFDRHFIRYTWGEPRPYEVALSLGKRPYLSHASAVFLHGLTDQIPKTIYINDEQTEKNFPPSVLTQEGIDRAFAGKQRTTRSIWGGDGIRVLTVSGKQTGRLEVGQLPAPDGSTADVTKLERTLIDIAVRPDYAGGPYQVREAYASARKRVSINVLIATLKKINHAYPYHQVIGFYMSRAGYEERQLAPLRKLGLKFNFYLTYGIKERDFDSGWKLFFPKGF